MFDAKLMFSENQTATTKAESTNAVDCGQESPDLGMLKKLHVSVIATTPFSGGSSPKLTVEVMHADDNGSGSPSSFETLVSTGAMDATKVEYLDIPLPIQHKRWLKLKYTTTGTPSAGKVTAGITDGTQKNPYYSREI